MGEQNCKLYVICYGRWVFETVVWLTLLLRCTVLHISCAIPDQRQSHQAQAETLRQLFQVSVNPSQHVIVRRDCQSTATVNLHAANGQALNEPASRCKFMYMYPRSIGSLYPDFTHMINYPRPSPLFPYYKRRKTGQWPGNEATVPDGGRTCRHGVVDS